MVTVEIWVVAVALLVGYLVGIIATKLVPGHKDGDLVVQRGRDKDVYSLEISTPLDDIPKKKEIRLAVRVTNRVEYSSYSGTVNAERR